MDAATPEAALDGIAIAEAAPSLTSARVDRQVSYETAVWIARAGRIAVIWLPIWALCVARFQTTGSALVASVVFLVIWKATLRRAYADHTVTVWTVGATVPALVGAFSGALFAAPLALSVPRLHLSLFALLEITMAVLLGSALWESTVASSLAARRRILLVGTEGGGMDLLEDVSLAAPRLPFRVIGVVDDTRTTHQIAGVPLHGTVDDLAEIVAEHQPQIVVLANDRCRAAAFERLVAVGHLGFAVVGLPEFYEYAFGRLPVRNLTPQWFMSILHLYRRPYSEMTKRVFDLVVASAVLAIVWPLLPFVALLVRLTGGPVIFRQVRLGEAGKPFTIYKFRTMTRDAERDGAVWASEQDPRITDIGRFMRKTRLDELPQLWNVLKGDMSFVGPRPERPEFVVELEAEVPFWSRRHLVKPGITGWAQVQHGYTADAAGTGDKLSYDLWYLRHRSLVVDIAICVKTFSTLLSGSGAR
jgi:exopolysaccharide biosynthesis polyprenyl glycosylphosphotransferase